MIRAAINIPFFSGLGVKSRGKKSNAEITVESKMSNGGSIDEGRAERERRKNFESPFDRFAIGGIRLKPNHEKRKKRNEREGRETE